MAANGRKREDTTVMVRRYSLIVTKHSTSQNPIFVEGDDVVRWIAGGITGAAVTVKFRPSRTPLLNRSRVDVPRRGFDDTTIDPRVKPGVYRYRTDGSTPSRRATSDDDPEVVAEPQMIVEGKRGRARKKR